MERSGSAPVHDALCVAAVIDRSVITTRRVHADVEVHGELTLGRTVFDVAARGGQPPNADVAFDADERKFVQLLLGTFAAATSGHEIGSGDDAPTRHLIDHDGRPLQARHEVVIDVDCHRSGLHSLSPATSMGAA
jgi:hypothetical protein